MEYGRTVSHLLIPRLFPVDIIVKTPSEIEAALGQVDFFLEEIITRGQVLYELGAANGFFIADFTD